MNREMSIASMAGKSWKMRLAMRPCYFAVDEETFTLYGTGWNGEPEDHLLMYKLEGLK